MQLLILLILAYFQITVGQVTNTPLDAAASIIFETIGEVRTYETTFKIISFFEIDILQKRYGEIEIFFNETIHSCTLADDIGECKNLIASSRPTQSKILKNLETLRLLLGFVQEKRTK